MTEDQNNTIQNDELDVEELRAALAECEKQRDEYLGGWQRAKADFINYKKDEGGKLQEIARYSGEVLLRELLSVLDSFDLGIAALEQKGPVEKGVYMIRAQLEDILKRYGLTKVEISPGDRYDPALAEAIAELPSDIPEGYVVDEIEAGYRLHDKLLRPARVRLSKGKL